MDYIYKWLKILIYANLPIIIDYYILIFFSDINIVGSYFFSRFLIAGMKFVTVGAYIYKKTEVLGPQLQKQV